MDAKMLRSDVFFQAVALPYELVTRHPVWERDCARMAEQATMHGASYVDLRTPSIGHDACQWPGTRWVEGLLPGVVDDGFTPMHPNATGMTSALPAILKTLGISA